MPRRNREKSRSISTQKWQASGESFNRGYRFTYDALNRLSEAVYGANNFGTHQNRYNEKVVEYSANGMMKRFQRRGLKSDGEYGKVDNLHITLDGNRIQYVYSPEGQKLRATWQTAVANIVVPLNTTAGLTNNQISSTTRTDYLGNVIYTGTASSYATDVSLSKYLFEGGYATVTPTTQPVFHYYTQDHLGNNRAVMGQGGTVEQITHYYPFGGFFADAGTGSSLQPYKYNGKELDCMHGLDLYDYGARQYDPIVPMFTQQDPVAEKYYHLSPYAYCANNPVNAIDPNGMEKLDVLDPNDRENKKIQQAIKTFNDEKDVINIWAHGSPNSMTVFDKNNEETITITDAKGFEDFLDKNSNVWKNRKKGEQVKIVLHSCKTGSLYKGKPGLAQRISSEIDDALIVAPNSDVFIKENKELGTYKDNTLTKESRWVQFERGKQIKTYKGNSQPGSKGFNYTNRNPSWMSFLSWIKKYL